MAEAGNKQDAELHGDLKLIFHQLEQLTKDTASGFSEINTRIRRMEEEQQKQAIFQGRTEQRLDTLEESNREGGGPHSLTKYSLALLGTALGIISTLIAQANL